MLFKVFLLILLIESSKAIDVLYLRQQPRLNDSNIIDYVFLCNVHGESLQWEVDGYSLGGFVRGQVGTVHTSSKGYFNYSATLLTSRQPLFASAITITLYSSRQLDVVCYGERGQNSTTNTVLPTDQQEIIDRSDVSGMVRVHTLFSSRLVQGNEELSITAFVCGVHQDYQSWEVEESGFPFGFSVLDSIGHTLPSPSPGRHSISQLAYLAAHEPYEIVSVLYITGPSNVTVTCASGQYEAVISVNTSLPSISVNTAFPSTFVSTNPMPSVTTAHHPILSSTEGINLGGDDKPRSLAVAVPWLTVAVIVLLATVTTTITITILAFMFYIRRRKKNTSVEETPNSLPDIKPESSPNIKPCSSDL